MRHGSCPNGMSGTSARPTLPCHGRRDPAPAGVHRRGAQRFDHGGRAAPADRAARPVSHAEPVGVEAAGPARRPRPPRPDSHAGRPPLPAGGRGRGCAVRGGGGERRGRRSVRHSGIQLAAAAVVTGGPRILAAGPTARADAARASRRAAAGRTAGGARARRRAPPTGRRSRSRRGPRRSRVARPDDPAHPGVTYHPIKDAPEVTVSLVTRARDRRPAAAALAEWAAQRSRLPRSAQTQA